LSYGMPRSDYSNSSNETNRVIKVNTMKNM
jgi:hypothetical protein